MPSDLGGLTSGLPSEIVFLHAFGVGAQRNVWTPEGVPLAGRGKGDRQRNLKGLKWIVPLSQGVLPGCQGCNGTKRTENRLGRDLADPGKSDCERSRDI